MSYDGDVRTGWDNPNGPHEFNPYRNSLSGCQDCGRTRNAKAHREARLLVDVLAQSDGGTVDDLSEATAYRERVQGELDDADHEWRKAIMRALDKGVPVRIIADTANVSRERVYQIRDGRR